VDAAILDAHRGPRPFGPAYARMFEEDVHAAGSVDRWLLDRMVWLCAETAPILYRAPVPGHSAYRAGTRPVLEALLPPGLPSAPPAAKVRAVVGACARIVRAADAPGPATLDDLRFGGAEEDIASRGSDWCTDVARVACRLCQVAGLPARLVILADTGAAYSGHAIIEAWRDGRWGAIDPVTAVVYEEAQARPAGTWALMNDPDLVRGHSRGRDTPFTCPEQFRAAAIAEYPWDAPGTLDVTGLNAYGRSILEMAGRGWPGGLRWLHGEDGPHAADR
jgi:transglutaminase-like putative cysteine protease